MNEIRPREQIMAEALERERDNMENDDLRNQIQDLKLEVLLDIRDILVEMRHAMLMEKL